MLHQLLDYMTREPVHLDMEPCEGKLGLLLQLLDMLMVLLLLLMFLDPYLYLEQDVLLLELLVLLDMDNRLNHLDHPLTQLLDMLLDKLLVQLDPLLNQLLNQRDQPLQLLVLRRRLLHRHRLSRLNNLHRMLLMVQGELLVVLLQAGPYSTYAQCHSRCCYSCGYESVATTSNAYAFAPYIPVGAGSRSPISVPGTAAYAGSTDSTGRDAGSSNNGTGSGSRSRA